MYLHGKRDLGIGVPVHQLMLGQRESNAQDHPAVDRVCVVERRGVDPQNRRAVAGVWVDDPADGLVDLEAEWGPKAQVVVGKCNSVERPEKWAGRKRGANQHRTEPAAAEVVNNP